MIDKDHSSEDQKMKDSSRDYLLVTDEDDPTLLVRPEVRKGSRLGDERVRLVLPARTAFRRVKTGLLEATEEIQQPRNNRERVLYAIKRTLIGTPIASAQAEHERLTKFKALAVLSSDAISSVAYATEAILITLVAAGSGSLGTTLPISLAIVALLSIVALSYRQTIPAYPNGGGSYIVAKDNLGTLPGLIAAASLLIDYVLTVSVSVASGVQTLASAFPALAPYIVVIDIVIVFMIMLVNLRGVRESGSIFAIPTYFFIFSALALIAIGLFKAYILNHQPFIAPFHPAMGTNAFPPISEPLTIFLILKAFAAGCSAMTGVEAISNGIPAFKKPETRNAAITLTWMATILGTLFIGITLLALTYGVSPTPGDSNPTVISQIAAHVFAGPLTFMFYLFSVGVLLVLVLAANTSFADFPRLSSLLARDNFMPHQFAFRGDRLAFSIGIVFLAILASVLLIVFGGNTDLLINLYAVGVFMSFTLSQGGMVRHWWKLRNEHPGWQRSMFINGLGAVTTMLVAIIIAFSKFSSGAWIVVILIPLLILMFLSIHHHYVHVERERTTEIPLSPRDIHHRLIVPIAHLKLASKQTLAYARSVAPQVSAVHVALDKKKAEDLRSEWQEWQASLGENEHSQLVILEPTHGLLHSLLDYVDNLQRQYPKDTLTVVLPEAASSSLLQRLKQDPITQRLKVALYFRPNVITTSVGIRQQQGEHIPTRPRQIQHRFIVPVAELDRASIQSLAYARSISPRVIAAHVAIEEQDVEHVRARWERLQKHLSKEDETQLVVIESPYRSLVRPLLAYIDTIRELHPEDTLTVLLPEFVVAHWWEFPLHNQTAFQLKAALLARSGIVVTNIPQHLRKGALRKEENSEH